MVAGPDQQLFYTTAAHSHSLHPAQRRRRRRRTRRPASRCSMARRAKPSSATRRASQRRSRGSYSKYLRAVKVIVLQNVNPIRSVIVAKRESVDVRNGAEEVASRRGAPRARVRPCCRPRRPLPRRRRRRGIPALSPSFATKAKIYLRRWSGARRRRGPTR